MKFKKGVQWLRRERRPPWPGRGAERPAAGEPTDVSPQPLPQPPQTGQDPSGTSDTRRPGRRSQAGRRIGKRAKTRQGIPILRPDEDPAHFFLPGEDISDDHRDGPAVEKKTACKRKLRGKKGRPLVKPRSSPPRNRVGIRQLDRGADLWGHFLAVDEKDSPAPHPPEQTTPSSRRAPPSDAPIDRHGIPRLDDHVDLHRFFERSLEDDAPRGEELGAVFSRSVQHDARTLMKKKAGGVWEPRRLTLQEQLRRYPGPQAQLDLHGARAQKARQRAESFIRTAAADGLFTLRLIVGKGLHSEGGAVLPDVIEDLLLALKKESLVLSFRWDKGLKRKSGAVIVYLAPTF